MIRAVLTATFVALPVLAHGKALEVQPVTEDVRATIGETEQRSDLEQFDSLGMLTWAAAKTRQIPSRC
jgi:hypothetical protein